MAICSDHSCHCEERSDAAIQERQAQSSPPLDCHAARAARNDGAIGDRSEQMAVCITPITCILRPVFSDTTTISWVTL